MTGRLRELAFLFAKLGVIGFGGPAAHIAMMEEEVVTRRGWLDRRRFLDMVGATNLIPGPNSTEMAIHVGWARAGWPGLAVAGACFILPAAAVTLAFAWAYVRFGTLPEAEPWLRGIQPAVLAVLLGAVWRLSRTAVRDVRLAALGAAALVAGVAGADPLLLLLASGIAGIFVASGRPLGGLPAADPGAAGETKGAEADDGDPAGSAGLAAPPALPLAGAVAVTLLAAGGLAAVAAVRPEISLTRLGLFFLEVGSVLYGSGYVLVAFLEGDLVAELGWLTQPELLDAIAIGQFTPGPVLSTATFIGYLLAGLAGAAVATVAIFLPSFAFVAALARFLPKVRQVPRLGRFLDGVNAGAVALMGAVLLRLGAGSLTSPAAWAVALAAAVAGLRFGVGAAWLVTGGALAGRLLPGW